MGKHFPSHEVKLFSPENDFRFRFFTKQRKMGKLFSEKMILPPTKHTRSIIYFYIKI